MNGHGTHDARAAPTRRAPHENTIAGARTEDASVDVRHRLAARWETLTHVERANLVAVMSTAMETAARAEIRADEPDADEARIRYLLAQRRYGTEIAEAAFGANSRWPQ